MAQSFKLVYTPEALEGISKLSSDLKKIAERVLVQIAQQPQLGKRLTGTFKGIYSERVTRRYRVLYLVKGPGFAQPPARGMKPRAGTAPDTPGKPGASSAVKFKERQVIILDVKHRREAYE